MKPLPKLFDPGNAEPGANLIDWMGDEEAPISNQQRQAMKNAVALIQEGFSRLIKII